MGNEQAMGLINNAGDYDESIRVQEVGDPIYLREATLDELMVELVSRGDLVAHGEDSARLSSAAVISTIKALREAR